MSNGIAGMPASPGIVDGPVHLLRWEVPDVRHRIIPDEAIPGEIKRFHAALEQARERLKQVRARAEKHAGPEEAAIFDVQLSTLRTGRYAPVRELSHHNLALRKAFDPCFRVRSSSPSRASAVGEERRLMTFTSVLRPVGMPVMNLSISEGIKQNPRHADLTRAHGAARREAIIACADSGTRTAHVAPRRSLGLPPWSDCVSDQRLNCPEHVILDGSWAFWQHPRLLS